MAIWSGMGITPYNPPYGSQTGTGNSYFISTAYATEIPKFAAIYSDAFPRIRIISQLSSDFGTSYPNTHSIANHMWALGIKEYKPTAYILYGVTQNSTLGFNSGNYSSFSTYMQSEAQWAQDNEMDAFCISNENLISNAHTTLAMTLSSLSRTSNVATGTTSSAHGLTTGDYILISGASPSNFNVTDSETVETVQVTVVNSTTFTYPSTGSDGSATGTIKMNWSALEVVRKVKALAVTAQGIFTRGPIEYSESQGHQTAWITVGITPNTDVDLIGVNIYGSGNNEASYTAWKSTVDQCWSAFSDNFIITEMSCGLQNSGNVIIGNRNHNQRGSEEGFDRETLRRITYARNLGVDQIYLYGVTEYNVFCNFNPWGAFGGTGYTVAYWTGRFKQLPDRIARKRLTTALFGTNAGGVEGG